MGVPSRFEELEIHKQVFSEDSTYLTTGFAAVDADSLRSGRLIQEMPCHGVPKLGVSAELLKPQGSVELLHEGRKFAGDRVADRQLDLICSSASLSPGTVAAFEPATKRSATSRWRREVIGSPKNEKHNNLKCSAEDEEVHETIKRLSLHSIKTNHRLSLSKYVSLI